MEFKPPIKKNIVILALGAESAGNFSVFKNGLVYFSEDFGDLLNIANFKKYKKRLNNYLKNKKIKPDIILTDMHPLYKTTILGQELAKEHKAKHIQVQHHIAHIFSQISRPTDCYGIVLDGTGYGTDGKIWGGEVFKISNSKFTRIGHLENQIMLGGELAIKEPARMLIGILSKFLSKKEIYNFVKKYYTRNKFELLYNQLQQNFNCIETSSTGRILDAVSLLLGFCKNERKYKHEPVDLLEANSAKPYNDLKPKIIEIYSKEERSMKYELSTTFLFEYLIKNLHKDKKRLAATAQLYIAQGLYRIILKSKFLNLESPIFLSGGLANNKIISQYFESKNFSTNKKTCPAKLSQSDFSGIPRGDAGISFGQVVYFLLGN